MRDYSLLKDIYLGDIENIQSEYGKREITLSECLFSFVNYKEIPNELNFNISKMMFEGYIQQAGSSKDINDLLNLTWKKLSSSTDFFIKMIENPHIQKFIEEHSEAIKEECKKNSNDNLWGIYYQLNNLNGDVEQKPLNRVNLLDKNLRASSDIDCELKSKIDAALELACFHKVLHDDFPLKEVGELIEKSKQITDIYLGRKKGTNSYSPLLHFLPMDIVETIAEFPTKEVSTNLWEHIQKFNLKTIKNSLLLDEIDELEVPDFIKKKTNEPVVETIWVLLKNGEMRLSHTYFDINEPRGIHHIDLASGEDVVSAGMAIFSKDMSKLLAINNRSGHYTPSLESIYETIPILKANGINAEDVFLADIYWNNPQPLVKHEDVLDTINKLREKAMPKKDASETLKVY